MIRMTKNVARKIRIFRSIRLSPGENVRVHAIIVAELELRNIQ